MSKRRIGDSLRRLARGALACVLAAGMTLSPVTPVLEAAFAAQPGGTGHVYSGSPVRYGGGADTCRFTVDGVTAWCSDPQYTAPKTGDYPVKKAHTRPNSEGFAHLDSNLRTLVYRAYGSPGFDRSYWPTRDWDGSAVTDDELYAYSHIMIADRMWAQGNIAMANTKTAFKRWYTREFLGYEYGGNPDIIVNENAVAIRLERQAGSPEDFQIIELDTGHNSKYRPGARSQTIITYIPEVEVRFSKCSADAEFTGSNPEYSVAGAEYDIFSASDDAKIDHIVMDESGHASLKLQPNKRYYAVETKAPKGYKLSTGRIEFTTGNSTAEEKLIDDPGRVIFRVRKKDSASKGAAQPGATLEGAEYKIVDANGNSHTATTDKEGRIVVRDLPLGKITVTEIKAPKGYKLDPTPKTYHIDAGKLTNAGIFELEPADDFIENVLAFDIELVKYKDTGNEGSGLQDPAPGVRFDIISNTTGKKIATIETDDRGYASTNGNWYGDGQRPEGVKGSIPYDSKGYTVREDPATTPAGYQPAPDWQITPQQMADGATLSYIVDNDFVTSHVQVVKADSETGQTVPLAGFRFQLLDEAKNPITQEVWYPNHAEMSEFETDESGMVTFPEALRPGTYYIREVAAKAPYLLNGEDLKVVIENDAQLAPVTVVKLTDDQAKGRASVLKTCSDDGKPLEGAEFDVVAMQDVVSPDGSVKAVEGEVVDHVKTGEDGTATTKELYLGSGEARYAFVETKAPSGHVLDPTPHEFTLTWKDQDTPIVEAHVDVVDQPNRLIIDKDVTGGDEPLPGVTFALWRGDREIPAASDDTVNLALRAPEGRKVEVAAASDTALIEAEGPLDIEWTLEDSEGAELEPVEARLWKVEKGVYKLTARRGSDEIASAEIKAKPGREYEATHETGIVGGERIRVSEAETEKVALEWSDEDGAYIGQAPVGRQRIEIDGRSVGELEVSEKTYARYNDSKLEALPILLKDGEEPAMHTTDEQGVIATDHLAEGEWRLRETAAPKGYLVDPTVRSLTVTADGLINGDADHTVAVENDYTKVQISKRDITNEAEVPGAKLSILDSDGNVVESWISGEEPHRIDRLEPGDYTLVEEMTPNRYDKATEVPFTVLPSGELQTVVMYDEPISITAKIDKRQEIADPVAKDTEANGDGANRADVTVSDKGEFDYSIDFRNTSSTWVDEFTVTDEIAGAAQGLSVLDAIATPVAGEDHDGKMNVWYKTNKTPADHHDESGANATLSDGHDNPWLADPSNSEALGDDGRRIDYAGWRLWKQDVSTAAVEKLAVSDLGLEEGEVVTAIRLEYGRVEKDFTSRIGEWDRDALKDPHDDLGTIDSTHKDDAMKVPGRATITLEDGSKTTMSIDDLSSAEDGAGWMIDANRDGAPEFYGTESVEIVEDAEVERSPLLLSMHVTDAYEPGTELANDATVEAYRNGGGEMLEDEDADRVVQAPKSTALPLPQTGIDTRRLGAALALVAGAVALLVIWSRLRPKTMLVTMDVFGNRI
ncbi:MAG: SpaA isopeptide-forming pilin-related protein [Collinsella intestinalis]|uniref:Cna protein B-type domain protein n=1 Tax=Collinsella intestinalis TaxID=147207 RepID=A0A6N2Z016_9ACTN